MRLRVTRPRLAIGIGVTTAAVAAAVVPALAGPAAIPPDSRTIDAQLVNDTHQDLTVYASVDNGIVSSQTAPTPHVVHPGQTFDHQTYGPEYTPCLFDDAETCLEMTFLVDRGDTTSSPTPGFKKAVRRIGAPGKDVRIPAKEGAGGNKVRLGNGAYDFTFHGWNPRGEANQGCVDNPQGYDVDEDDEGIAVLDYSVTWTITEDPQYGYAYDGC